MKGAISMNHIPSPTELSGSIPQVVPFTIRENPSIMYQVESMRVWIRDVLTPFINSQISELIEGWDDEKNSLIEGWTQLSAELIQRVDTAVSEIGDAVDEAEQFKLAAEAARDLAEIYASQAEAIQDIAIENIVSDSGSNTRNILDSLYASSQNFLDLADTVDNIGNDVSTRLSDSELNSRYETYVNVKTRGVVGDGVTDDSVAFNSAIASGGKFFIPNGEYSLTKSIKVPSNTELVGESESGVIIKLSDSADNVQNVITNASNNGISKDQADVNIHISNLTVDGNAWNREVVSLNSTYQSAITLSCVRNSSIKNVTAKNGVLHNIDVCASVYKISGMGYASGPSEDIVIDSCTAIDARFDDGITTHYSSNITISNCFSTRTGAYPYEYQQNGIEIDDGSRNVTVINCRASGVETGLQIKGHGDREPASGVSVDTFKSTNCGKGVQLTWAHPSDSPLRGQNVTLSNITVENSAERTDGGEIPAALWIEWYANVSVNNVLIKDCPNGGQIWLGRMVDDITISNVKVVNSFNTVPYDVNSGFLHSDLRNSGQHRYENFDLDGISGIAIYLGGNNSTPNDTRQTILRNIKATAIEEIDGPAVNIAFASGSGYLDAKFIESSGYSSTFGVKSGAYLPDLASSNSNYSLNLGNGEESVELNEGWSGTINACTMNGFIYLYLYGIKPPAGTVSRSTAALLPVHLWPRRIATFRMSHRLGTPTGDDRFEIQTNGAINGPFLSEHDVYSGTIIYPSR